MQRCPITERKILDKLAQSYPSPVRKSIAPLGKGYAFFCRASLSLSRLVRSAPRPSLLPRTRSSLMKPIAQPEGPPPLALLPLIV
jgi:hypothetical protein